MFLHKYTPHFVMYLSPSINNQPSTTSIPVNDHHMLTRVRIGKSKPKYFLFYSEPSTTKQYLSQHVWFVSIKDECNSLLNNGTWTLTYLLRHRKSTGYKWMFKIKENIDGSVNKYKTRLVVKGFHQQQRFDFHETFFTCCKTYHH